MPTSLHLLPVTQRIAILRAAGENIQGTKLWHDTLAEYRRELGDAARAEWRQQWTGAEA